MHALEHLLGGTVETIEVALSLMQALQSYEEPFIITFFFTLGRTANNSQQ